MKVTLCTSAAHVKESRQLIANIQFDFDAQGHCPVELDEAEGNRIATTFPALGLCVCDVTEVVEVVEEVVEVVEEEIVEDAPLAINASTLASMKKADLKDVLDACGIEYADDATNSTLRAIIKENL